MTKKDEPKLKKRSSKKKASPPQTVRQKLESGAVEKKRGRGRWLTSRVGQWLQTPVLTHQTSSSRIGIILTKQRSMFPKYVRQSWAEVGQVTWPRFGKAMELTWAVFVFAAIFSVIVSVLDWGLSKIFTEFILNKSTNIIEFIDNLF